jgi:endonuclease I
MKLKLLLLLLSCSCFGQIPAYYSGIDFSQSGENIKNQLATLITATHTTELVYTSGSSGLLDTWTVLKQSDLDLSNLNNVFLIYGWNDQSTTVSEHRSRSVNESCHTSSCNGKWVREHVFPRSIGTPNLGSEGAGSDAHNLRAIDAQRNNTRGNRLFGAANSSIPSYSISSNSWYPGDEWIGDVARIIMYMYLRYPTQCAAMDVATGGSTFAPLGDMPDILLQWNSQDPPSDFEMNRNNIIATNQGNRNPFIDNPYLATLIWNGQQAVDSWNALHVDEIKAASIKLYPTITNGLVYVENSTSDNLKYTLYNSVGQLLKEAILEQEIDLFGHAKGLYFIQVSSQGNSKTFKVIKD